MRRYNGQLIFSATDLVTFLDCRHATFLDHRQLEDPAPLPAEDPYVELLQQKGLEHERSYREQLRTQGLNVIDIPSRGSLEERTEQTRAAMAAGPQVIYQGAFSDGRWHGYADFLLRVPGESRFGDYHYEPLDTKLAHATKPKHLMQLGIYADLLARVQARAPERLHVALGTGETVLLPTRDFQHYLAGARARFETFVDAMPKESHGEPCSACSLCRWRERCEGEWAAADHLSLVARITRGQREKLNAAGVTTMAQLAALPPATPIASLQPDTLERLRAQARLQDGKRRDGQNRHELLPAVDGKGFARLPRPSAGDLFFDMEGDPLLDGGLEYLFGFAFLEPAQPTFRLFWGHDRVAEKAAFEAAMDFIAERLAAFPDAHIYHYASYEESALKRLAMMHGTRETQVDDLLRQGRLVDLYQVVREALRVSEPSYSLKNLEVFYMRPREGAVTTANASVVAYERWRKLADPRLLEEIARYNEADCISTLKLRDWLIKLRPRALPWRERPPADPEEERRTAERLAAEASLAATTARLLRCSESERPYRELISQLLEFHHREAKPQWWWQFRRAEMTEEELIEDAECIGALRRDPAAPPLREKLSLVHTFTFPAQDFKLRTGSRPRRAGTREPVGELVLLDEDARRLQLKAGPRTPPLDDTLSLIPEAPFDDKVLREAIYRYGQAVIAGDERYGAVTSVLKRELPRIRGRAPGAPLLPADADTISGSLAAIKDLQQSHLLVQGPPGAGKTFLSAAAIVELLHQGRRVGVASHSHKAINRLLEEVEKRAESQGRTFQGVKKCSEEEQCCNGSMIEDVFKNEHVKGRHQLVAGTAWLFADPVLDQSLDVLFIDEAGQVSLANLVAMGLAARNLVLVGDQMQLAQPIQGTHPGRSGASALEFLLEEHATVPPERGVFLDVTRRMHPDVCRFISEAVYEGRLHSHASTEVQRLIVSPGADPALKASGLSFVPVLHQECRQKSEEEGQRVREIFGSLLQQRWIGPQGRERPLAIDDILIVSPYNMQVNLLQSLLPPGARVGTVDKFQGQEAAVVIVSMTTSSAEDMPRGMEFLYSRNRLNVAISRARSLAIVVASPLLLEAPCGRVEQMKLVNTLCYARVYAASLAAAAITG
ncbi:MAG: TM0106 family RecB-like putative nuclease [Gammaproteobacteria bacterium]|nr:MAG: TM0106 family RecB-like putative nuclease [Gammaproteobacteria bacterium]